MAWAELSGAAKNFANSWVTLSRIVPPWVWCSNCISSFKSIFTLSFTTSTILYSSSNADSSFALYSRISSHSSLSSMCWPIIISKESSPSYAMSASSSFWILFYSSGWLFAWNKIITFRFFVSSSLFETFFWGLSSSKSSSELYESRFTSYCLIYEVSCLVSYFSVPFKFLTFFVPFFWPSDFIGSCSLKLTDS